MDREKCGNKCEDMTPACVSFFVHENTVQHMNISNKRMLIALLTVCITFILTIVIFVVGYTVRDMNWLDTLSRVTVAEGENGVHEYSDP